MDEPVVPAAKSAPRERTFFDVAVDRIWRFFCSTRIAIAQITVVAVLVGGLVAAKDMRGQAVVDFPYTTQAYAAEKLA